MEPCRPNAAVDMIPNPRYIIKRSEKVFFGKKKNAAPAVTTVQKTAPLFDKGMNVLVTRHRAQRWVKIRRMGGSLRRTASPAAHGEGDYRG